MKKNLHDVSIPKKSRTLRLAELTYWLWHSEKIGAQVTLIIGALYWFLVLLFNPNPALPESRYAAALSIFTEDQWTILFGAALVLQIAALWTQKPRLYLIAGLVAVFVHGGMTWNFTYLTLIQEGRGLSPGAGGEFAMTVTAALVYLFAPWHCPPVFRRKG